MAIRLVLLEYNHRDIPTGNGLGIDVFFANNARYGGSPRPYRHGDRCDAGAGVGIFSIREMRDVNRGQSKNVTW